MRGRALSDELETFDEGLLEEGIIDSTYGYEQQQAQGI